MVTGSQQMCIWLNQLNCNDYKKKGDEPSGECRHVSGGGNTDNFLCHTIRRKFRGTIVPNNHYNTLKFPDKAC